MSTLDTLLKDGLQSEIMLQLQLKAMRKALSQQLHEAKQKQTEELERRIYENSLLSSDGDGKSNDDKELKHKPEFVRMRRSISLSAQTSDKESSSKPKQRPYTRVQASSTHAEHCSSRDQQCERFALSKTTQQTREEADEVECKKKFCTVPVPIHIIQTNYQEMIELKEQDRKQGREERKLFLLSIQKPFSFEKRETSKKEKLLQTLQVSQDPKNKVCVKKIPHKDIKDSQQLKDQKGVCRKVHTQMTTQQKNPSQTQSPNIRSADLTRKQKLGFLYEEPSFQPKIIHTVPNFSRLHKALQNNVLEKMQNKDTTKCEPFFLRTSNLPARKSLQNTETSQVVKLSNLSRSKPLGALTLMSTNTLPTYITDAVRQCRTAIRKSMDLRESKNRESSDWLKNYQMRSQSMRKTIALRATLLDPHSSLKDVFRENLKRHREADQQRTREYMRELKDMKTRVSERPYLFEQIKQRNAKVHAEQIYRDKLQKVGLKEQFVEENGKLFRSDDTETDDQSTGDEMQSRDENVDDGEKIEDVEEKSVKSKGEETP